MPSPIALNPASPSSSIFKKKKSSSFPASAASYLSAVSQADQRARAHGNTPTSTPALSLSSSVTTSSEDTVLYEDPKIWDNEDGLSYPAVPPTSEQVFQTIHSEFGHCANEDYRYVSQHKPGEPLKNLEEQEPPYYIVLSTYLSYMIMIILGHVRDFTGKRLRPSAYNHLRPHQVFFSFSASPAHCLTFY
jgi:serine palmitoyltransferase